MSNGYGNPYENGGNNNGNRPAYGGGNGGGRPGGGRGNFPQQEPLTPEELERLKLPVAFAFGGNNQIPDKHAMTLDKLVKAVEAKRIAVRCGGDTEADMAVFKAAKYPELHLPWKGFNKDQGIPEELKGNSSSFNDDKCYEYARRYFIGDYANAKGVIRATHGKNARLLFGKRLNNRACAAIVWTDDGAENAASTNSRSGVAGHLIRMACAAGIPVFNINNPDAEQRVMALLEHIYVQQPPEQPAAPADRNENRQLQGTGRSGFGGQLDDEIPY